jgi:2-polyprenyl-3-methyl-5-hydroxy-6-metoxy-1,4-benzoquinol methylase
MKAIEYFEKVSSAYDETVSKGILKWARDRERKAVLDFCAFDGKGRMIDVGCGAGFYALVAKQAGHTVTAVDASMGMVMRLNGKVDEAEVADVENYEPHATYQRVVCAGVLDFVLHPEKATRNLARLVAPGGRLILLSPRRGLGGLFYRIEKFFFGIKVNLYTRAWLSRVLGEEGLKLVAHAHPLPTNMALLFERPAK